MAKMPFPPKKKLVEGSKAEEAMDKKMGVVPAKKKAGAKPNPFQAKKGAPPVAAPAFKKGGKVK